MLPKHMKSWPPLYLPLNKHCRARSCRSILAFNQNWTSWAVTSTSQWPDCFQWSRNMPDMPDMSGRLLLMSGRELIPCRTFCPAGFNTHKMSERKNKNDHCYEPVINWEKCLAGAQNVRQSAEGLLDILSGTPKIIFAITVLLRVYSFMGSKSIKCSCSILRRIYWHQCSLNGRFYAVHGIKPKLDQKGSYAYRLSLAEP